MTRHLRPDEFVDALEGALSPALRQHVDGCEACRAELDALRVTLTDASGLPPVAPSPLFWDHFSARVRAATAQESVAPESAWRAWAWLRPAAAFVAVAGAIALMFVLRPGTAGTTESDDAVAVSDVASASGVAEMNDPEENTAWDLVMALASEFDADVVREAVMPQSGAADAMIERLTEAQRSELARLLKQEMGTN